MVSLLQERGNWPPDVDRKLGLIIQQTHRLQTVIKKVKLATRPPEARFEKVDIGEIINETIALAEPLIIRAKTKMTIDWEKNLPMLHADRNRIQTALFNMIQNALEAMPQGGEIKVFAGMAPDQKELLISVADTGRGIPPEIIERICEPFFSTHEEEGFRGLGLSIVSDIVKLHGGRLDVRSVQGKGTKIFLYFPVRL